MLPSPAGRFKMQVNQLHARILRLPDVVHRVGYGRSTIYQKIQDGTFPVPLRLGSKATGWLESDIENWIASLKRVGGEK